MLAANNFFADLAALTAVNILLKKRVRALRILAGAALGTLGSCLAFAACRNMAAYLMLVHFLLNPLVLFFCFREKNRKDFLTELCAGYLALFIMSGVMEWLYAGGRGFFTYAAAAAAAPALLIAAALWGVRQWKNRGRYLQVRIRQGVRQIRLQALSDSGNLLRDPYTGRQVSLIDRDVYQAAFGRPESVRLIPYESLGCRHGLLEAVTIEELSCTQGKNAGNACPDAVLGLAEHALFERKPYQMILNPEGLAAVHSSYPIREKV